MPLFPRRARRVREAAAESASASLVRGPVQRIASVDDLKRAIQAVKGAKNPDRAREQVTRRAREMNQTGLIPADWTAQRSREAGVDPLDLSGKGVRDTLDLSGTPQDTLDLTGKGGDTSAIDLSDGTDRPGVDPDDLDTSPDNTCGFCGGTGKEDNETACSWCGGTGKTASDGDADGDSAESAVSDRLVKRGQESHRMRETAAARPISKKGDAFEVVMIEEGLGNPTDKNYYSAKYLRRLVESGKLEGLRGYSDHASKSEERDLPERSVKKLAGYYRNVRYREAGGRAQVVGEFVPFGSEAGREARAMIESALEHAKDAPGAPPIIGISLDGIGSGRWDEHPEHGRVFMQEEPVSVGSADIVTTPGAGGRFVRRLTESFRTAIVRKLGESFRTAIGREATTTQEAAMKPEELQQAFAATARKIRESIAAIHKGAQDSATDQESEQAVNAVGDLHAHASELERLAGVKIEHQVREVKVTDDADTTRQLREAAAIKDRAEQLEAENRELKAKVTLHERQILAAKVMRESKVSDDPYLRVAVTPDELVRLDSETAMTQYVEREKAKASAITASFRESYGAVPGVEGAGPRLPEQADTSGDAFWREAGIPVRQEPAAA